MISVAYMIMQITPSKILVSILTGFILGVLFFSYFVNPIAIVLAIVLVAGISVFGFLRAVPLSFGEGLGVRRGVAVLLASGLCLGFLRLSLAVPGADSVAYQLGQSASVAGVDYKVDVNDGQQQITLGDLEIDGTKATDYLLVSAPSEPKAELGSRIGLTCNVEAPQPFNGFAYDRFLAAKHIYATCSTSDQVFTLEPDAVHNLYKLYILIGRLHEDVVAMIDDEFAKPEADLLAGLLMGDNNFSPEWKERFMLTGTSHVVAASGYNIAMVSLLAMGFLIALGLRRQTAYPLVLLSIFLFVIVAGGAGAVTRAAIMGALALTAMQVGRKSSAKNILLLTVGLMLMIEPRLLRDDVGFQLSVLSTAGLLYFAKPFSEKLDFIPEKFGLRESFACTLAATFATLPVTLMSFGRLSIVGPFTNLLVLPFLPYAMAAGAFAVFTHFFVGASTILALPATILLEIILQVIQAFASLPFAVITF